jgi:hypothetical protein
MAKYKIDGEVIDMVRWTGCNLEEIELLAEIQVTVQTEYERIELDPGDYVTKNNKGEVSVFTNSWVEDALGQGSIIKIPDAD